MVRTSPRSKALRDQAPTASTGTAWLATDMTRGSRLKERPKSERATAVETSRVLREGGILRGVGEASRGTWSPRDQQLTGPAMGPPAGLDHLIALWAVRQHRVTRETRRTSRSAAGCNKPASPAPPEAVRSQERNLTIGGENRRGCAKQRGRHEAASGSSRPEAMATSREWTPRMESMER